VASAITGVHCSTIIKHNDSGSIAISERVVTRLFCRMHHTTHDGMMTLWVACRLEPGVKSNPRKIGREDANKLTPPDCSPNQQLPSNTTDHQWLSKGTRNDQGAILRGRDRHLRAVRGSGFEPSWHSVPNTQIEEAGSAIFTPSSQIRARIESMCALAYASCEASGAHRTQTTDAIIRTAAGALR